MTTPLKIFLSVLLLAISLVAQAALKPGDLAPNFSANGSLNGNDFHFSLAAALTQGPVVVYFFPSAFTQGCDIEAHTFATKMSQFKQAGASVIGVSADSLKRLHLFSKDPDFCAGKFPVISDPHGKIAAPYDVMMAAAKQAATDVRGNPIKHGFFQRTTYVINRKGLVVATLSTALDGLSPVDHVLKSLAIVRQLAPVGSQHCRPSHGGYTLSAKPCGLHTMCTKLCGPN